MKKIILIVVFVLLNSIAIAGCHALWNTSSMAAASMWMVVAGAGGLGSFIGGFLASKNFYHKVSSHWIFGVLAALIFLGISKWASGIDYPHEANGPFPQNPWHENGFVWMYLIISSLWMLVQATRTK